MDYTLENAYLKVTVTTDGAQVKSVIRKSDGVEHMWCADPAVWGSSAPVMFPNTGRLKDGILEVKGKQYTGRIHGFARICQHSLVYHNKQTLVLQLTENEQTLNSWPFRFRLLSAFTLEDDTLHHTLTVENRDEESFTFGIGFHPGFAIPFDSGHQATDYELRFSSMESPLCMGFSDRGLSNGTCYYLGKNIQSIAIDDQLFANDSHCMLNISSKTLGLYEKDSGRAVVCKIENFPYVLIWSKPGMPRFVCIEPWHSLPSAEDGSYAWEEKPAAAKLAPGETWTTTMETSFVR